MQGGEEMMEELANMITSVGFPIAVAGYLLIRQESKMTDLTKAITDLTRVVDKYEKS